MEPTWKDIKFLNRSHIELYIEWLYKYAYSNESKRLSNSKCYIDKSLVIVEKFLTDIQRYNYHIAPNISIRVLIQPGDKPKLQNRNLNKIDYIPDYILEQLFTHINDLHKEVTPILWIAFKTGLRISDILGLKTNCLLQINDKYSIVADIEKTYVKGHHIPIDNELAGILSILIQRSKEQSNNDNNPDQRIFVRYYGSRKGKPFPKIGFVMN